MRFYTVMEIQKHYQLRNTCVKHAIQSIQKITKTAEKYICACVAKQNPANRRL